MGGTAQVAHGTDFALFAFSYGIFEFQAMVTTDLTWLRALRVARDRNRPWWTAARAGRVGQEAQHG